MTTIDDIMQPRRLASAGEQAAALKLVTLVSEAIRAAGAEGIPSDNVYVLLCGVVSLQAYEGIVANVIGAKLARRQGDLLVWTGPVF
jgi:hypothetical protein